MAQEFLYRGRAGRGPGPNDIFKIPSPKNIYIILPRIFPYFRLICIFDRPPSPHMYDSEWRNERGGAVNCGAIHCWRKFEDSPQRAPTPTLRLVENRERLPGFPHCEKIKVFFSFFSTYFGPFEK